MDTNITTQTAQGLLKLENACDNLNYDQRCSLRWAIQDVARAMNDLSEALKSDEAKEFIYSSKTSIELAEISLRHALKWALRAYEGPTIVERELKEVK